MTVYLLQSISKHVGFQDSLFAVVPFVNYGLVLWAYLLLDIIYFKAKGHYLITK